MTPAAARREAFEHLSRLYTVRRGSPLAAPSASVAAVWSVEVEVDGPSSPRRLTLILKLERDFPLSLPRVYLSGGDVRDLGYPPNVGTDGSVCTFDPTTTTVNPEAPGAVVAECVRRAVTIIEAALAGVPPGRYDEEFVAYWENRYPLEPPVDDGVLSLADEGLPPDDRVRYVHLKGRVGPYHAAVFSRPREFADFERYLKDRGTGFEAVDTLHLGELPDLAPPFHLRNADVGRLLDRLGLQDALGRHLEALDAKFPTPVVTFSKSVGGRHLILGWRHRSLVPQVSGRRQRRSLSGPYARSFLTRDRFSYVTRFSPQVLTAERLHRRTAGDYARVWEQGLSLLVAGLGSVGSHLVPLLASLDVREFRLVDPEALSLENIGRHWLGIEDVGRAKVEGIKRRLLDKDPLRAVLAEREKIVPLALERPEYLNECDHLFFCLGDPNSEFWLSDALVAGGLTKPAFFVWVEPYLAGGHCVFLNGRDGAGLRDVFDGYVFRYNAIAREEHERRGFSRREAGCQTTHFPFDRGSVNLFLAALFPRIFHLMRQAEPPSACLSWVGDKARVADLGIGLSPFALDSDSFAVTERSVC